MAGALTVLATLWLAIGGATPESMSIAAAASGCVREPLAVELEPTEPRPSSTGTSGCTLPPPSARIAPEPRIRGRLLESSTGLPIPGRTIRLHEQREDAGTSETSLASADRDWTTFRLDFAGGYRMHSLDDKAIPHPQLEPASGSPGLPVGNVDSLNRPELASPRSASSPVFSSFQEPRDSRIVAETRTDADGRFELPCGEAASAWLESPLQDGRFAEHSTYELPARESACGGEIAWSVALHPAGVFRARVVDDRTGEPVPSLFASLSVEGAGRWSLFTDAQGRLESVQPMPAGRVDATFLEGDFEVPLPSGSASVEFDPGAPNAVEPVFRVSIGPTYRFLVDGPPGVALPKLQVMLGNLYSHEPTPVWDNSMSADPYFNWTDLSDGEPRSVRYPLRGRRSLEGLPIVAELRTPDGKIGGCVEIPDAPAGESAPVRVRVAARSTLAGRVREGRGLPAAGARVQVWRWDPLESTCRHASLSIL